MKSEIEIHFDGGCQPNPGRKYGSFEVSLDGVQVVKVSRMELGFGTNNEAEFDALREALDWTVGALRSGGYLASTYEVVMFTDSRILANRMNRRNFEGLKRGSPQSREASWRMASLARVCGGLLCGFKLWRVEWRGRAANVSRFGH